ncbi:hypothetical protein HK101_007345 [Irineochytrium annulatum]|nr:hypothetical protein HK101_007345 [Irineochytrium annulatum]
MLARTRIPAPAALSRTLPSAIPTVRAFSSTPASLSQIGKRPLKVPKEITITVNPRPQNLPTNQPGSLKRVTVTGPLGTLHMDLAPFASVLPAPSAEAGREVLAVSVAEPRDRRQKAMWGTTRALLDRMVEGVGEGFAVPVKLVGVGYRVALEDATKDDLLGEVRYGQPAGKTLEALGKRKKVVARLGYSHTVEIMVPEGVTVRVFNPQAMLLTGIDLQEVTQFAAKIRKWRPPEPYNQKGVFVGGETIKKKEGKKR